MTRKGFAERRNALFAEIEFLLAWGVRGMADMASHVGYRDQWSLHRHLSRHRPDLIVRIREPL